MVPVAEWDQQEGVVDLAARDEVVVGHADVKVERRPRR